MPKTFERLLLISVTLLLVGGFPVATVGPVMRWGPLRPVFVDSGSPAILESALDVVRLPVRFKNPLQSAGGYFQPSTEKPKPPLELTDS